MSCWVGPGRPATTAHGFPGLSAAPGVRVSTHRALHMPCPLVSRLGRLPVSGSREWRSSLLPQLAKRYGWFGATDGMWGALLDEFGVICSLIPEKYSNLMPMIDGKSQSTS